MFCFYPYTAPPQLVSAPVDAQAGLTNSVTFHCGFSGNPTPRIKWLKDSIPVPLTTSDKYDVQLEGTLLVRDLRRTDEGTYECVAENVAGTARAYARLTVWGKEAKWLYADIARALKLLPNAQPVKSISS